MFEVSMVIVVRWRKLVQVALWLFFFSAAINKNDNLFKGQSSLKFNVFLKKNNLI